MAGKFELYKDRRGRFRFCLIMGNGHNILASEGYKQKASASNGINSIRKNAANDCRYECKYTIRGKFMFNLKSANGLVIGASKSYDTEMERDNAINLVKKNAPDANVDDLTQQAIWKTTVNTCPA